MVHGQPHWLLGFTEDQMLIVSKIDPCDDYDGSLAIREYLCADHFSKN